MNLRDNLHDGFKEILAAQLPRDHFDMRVFRRLLRGNFQWMVRQLIGGVPSDSKENIERWIKEGVMLPPDEFTRKRRYEDLKRKDKQHS